MALTGQQYLKLVQHRGIPDAWQEFGWLLSNQAALSTQLVAAVRDWRDSGSPEARQQVARLFDDLDKNLGRARTVVDEKLAHYDASGRWRQLDQAVHGMDPDDVISALAADFTLHPLPVVLESLRFNLGYVIEHGYRAFYQMTADYLARLAGLLDASRQRLMTVDLSSAPFPPWELFRLDLNMIEVPTHCDVCRMVASYGEYALDQPPA